MRIIHINRNIIQSNAKHGKADPVVRVEDDGAITYCMEVEILGPSRMVYRPDKPRPCGAKLWIETTSALILHNSHAPFAHLPCSPRISVGTEPDATR